MNKIFKKKKRSPSGIFLGSLNERIFIGNSTFNNGRYLVPTATTPYPV